MGRTALFNRKQPGGVFTIENLQEHPGDIYFVDSGNTYASDVTGASSNGNILIEDVVIANNATAMDSGANGADLDLSTDNAAHAIGATFATIDDDGVGANVTLGGIAGGFTTFNPVVLETGKKVQVAAGDENFTSGGEVQITLVCRRMADGATVAAAA